MVRQTAGQTKVLVVARTSDTFAPCFVPACQVLNVDLAVFVGESWSLFTLIQSRVHEFWARSLSGSLKDDLRYTPTRCFVTFPFPFDWESNHPLREKGLQYHQFRSDLMIKNNEGLTKTYNRFHNPDEDQSLILELRELHSAMDRAVLDAYGWADIQPTCEFLLDYEDEEDEGEEGTGRRRKKPWRYRWPDDTRDEVLARLLALNAQRAQEERQQTLLQQAAESPGTYTKPKRSRKPKVSAPSLPMHDNEGQ
jgi:hypothetical protein